MDAAVWAIGMTRPLESEGVPAADNRIERATADRDESLPQQDVIEEWQIVRRAQNYDEDALHQLYEAYYPKIYNYAFLQMGDVQAAEDLASDVMLKMLESIKKYNFRGLPFGAWVFRIARNRLIDLHRRRKRRGEVDLSETLSGTLASPESMAERALERGQLQIALKHLTDEQRQVIVLKFIQGFDNRSVGKIMGRSEGAVKSLQHRALGALRRVLQQEPSR
jgi:RNA polymerase sigma-70 factor (ECF subfamily)